VPNKATREQKAFLRDILESEEYRTSFRRRVVRGDAGLEQMMHYYVLGKPKETLAVESLPPMLIVDELTGEDIARVRAERDDA
jgi:hypothetical protein